MRKLLYLFSIFAVVLSCSSDETSTLVTPPPAPIVKYTITLSAGEGGTVSSTGGEYEAGQTVSVTATPQGEYLFKDWSDGNTDATRTITVSSNTSLTANFEKRKYPLTVNFEGEGEVIEEIINAGRSTDYDSGTTVKLTAVPAEGWEFGGWSGDVQSMENPFTLEITSNIEVSVSFIKNEILFVNRSPNYPAINNSSGNVRTNYYHPGFILTPDIIFNYIDIFDSGCLYCGPDTSFRLWNNSSRYLDFNNDGKTDLFGFLMNNSGGYGVGYGKYVVVDDIFNNPTTSYYDCNIWFGGRMEVNDFNGDGKDDILVFNQNDHDDNQGGYFTERTPLEIIYFNNDGSFNVVQIGQPTAAHELTSFDIDSDGDIDIVNFGWGGPTDKSVQVPLFYLNDGNGNFEVVDSNFLQRDYYREIQVNYSWTAVDSFDLDNDGFMDIILGNVTVNETGYCLYDNPNDPFERNCYVNQSVEGLRILWGNENRTYSEENMTVFEDEYFSTGASKGILGFNFIDINNDGLYEVVSTGFHNGGVNGYGPYSGGFLDLYSNLGGRSFTRITNSSIDVNEWLYQNKSYVDTGDIPLFYDIAIIDVDDDGSYDIMPHTINTGFILLLDSQNGVDRLKYQTNIGANFYWKNIGGYFELQEDRKDYQND